MKMLGSRYDKDAQIAGIEVLNSRNNIFKSRHPRSCSGLRLPSESCLYSNVFEAQVPFSYIRPLFKLQKGETS